MKVELCARCKEYSPPCKIKRPSIEIYLYLDGPSAHIVRVASVLFVKVTLSCMSMEKGLSVMGGCQCFKRDCEAGYGPGCHALQAMRSRKWSCSCLSLYMRGQLIVVVVVAGGGGSPILEVTRMYGSKDPLFQHRCHPKTPHFYNRMCSHPKTP